MPSSTRNRPPSNTDQRFGGFSRKSDAAFEIEWDWPRASLAEVPCEAYDFRTTRHAARAGFLDGIGRALDMSGALPIQFFRRPPYEDDTEALIDDWCLVRGDLLIAQTRLHNRLVRRWPEHNWPDLQGTLFDPDVIES